MPYVTDPTTTGEFVDTLLEAIKEGIEYSAQTDVTTIYNDAGELIGNAVRTTVQSANGQASTAWNLIAPAAGAGAAVKSTGAALLTMEVPTTLAIVAPAIGIAAGIGLYNLAPSFFNGLADALYGGSTTGGKIWAFLHDDGRISLPASTIERIANYCNENNLFDKYLSYTSPEEYFESIEGHEYLSNKVILDGMNYQVLTYFRKGDQVTSPLYFGNPVKSIDSPDDILSFTGISIDSTGEPIYIGTILYNKGNDNVKIDSEIVNIRYDFENETISVENTNAGTTTLKPGGSVSFFDKIIGSHTTSSGWTLNSDIIIGGANVGNSAFGSIDEILYQYLQIYLNNEGEIQKNPLLNPNAKIPSKFPMSLTETYPTWKPIPGNGVLPDTYPVQLPDVEINPDPSKWPVEAPTGAPDQFPYQNSWPKETPDTLAPFITTNEPSNPNTSPEAQPQPTPSSPTVPDPDPQPEPAPDPSGEGTITPAPPGINPPNPNPDPEGSGDTPLIPPMERFEGGALYTVYTDFSPDALGSYLWSSDIIDQITRIFSNSPLDAIISMHKVYCPVNAAESKNNIYLGYLDSGVPASIVTNQFTEIDCESVTVKEVRKNPTDYSPYASAHIYLPFIGIVELDVDEIMGGSVNVKYGVDVYTGTCLAKIYVTRENDMKSPQLLYTFSGNCAQSIPLTSGSSGGMIGALLTIGASAISGAVGGGVTGAATSAGVAAIQSLSHEVLHVNHSGSLSSNAGILGPRKPYLIISRRYGYDANGYNNMYGFPANKTVYIGNCTGYIRCKATRLISKATQAEKNEIMQLLGNGVYM